MAYAPGVLDWRAGDSARLTKRQMSLDGTHASVLAVDTARGLGVFTSPTGENPNGSSGLRDIWTLNDSPARTKRARSTFWGSPWMGSGSPIGTILPQHGLGLNVAESGGRRRAITVWQNITFGVTWSILVGAWTADAPNGGNFVNRQVGLQVGSLVKTSTVLSSSRSDGVVTLELNEHAQFVPGAYGIVDVGTASFDGHHLIDSVEGNRVRYRQAGPNESGGSGTLNSIFPYDIDVWMPDDSSNIVQVRAKRRSDPDWPEWVPFDSDAGLIMPTVAAGDYASMAHDADFNLTGVITLVTDVTPVDWTPGLHMSLLSKFTTSNPSGQRQYRSRLLNNGRIDFGWATAGLTGLTIQTVNPLPELPNNTRRALAVEFNPNDGAGNKRLKVYTAPTHKGPWTLFEEVISPGTTTVFQGTAPLELGSVNSGALELFQGRFHFAQVLNGNLQTGVPVVEFIPNNAQDGVTTWTDPTSTNDWVINGSARLENTGIVAGAQAFAVDIDMTGTYAVRTAAGNVVPIGQAGPSGPIAAHLGTNPLSHVEVAWTAFSGTDTLPLDLDDPTNDLSASLVYWADRRDQAYGEPTRDYFQTIADAQVAALRLSPGQFVEVRGPGT